LTAKKFRRRAEICLRFAARLSEPAIAQRLRLIASEYLAMAEAADPASDRVGSGEDRREAKKKDGSA